jgi:ATP-dependent Clp protease ATP-binding subunit ClpC
MTKPSASAAPGGLFLPEGHLNFQRLAPDAQDVLQACLRWLEGLGRAVLLPIDLMVILLERGHSDLHRTFSLATRGVDDVPDLKEQLSALARRVEREEHDRPRLHTSQMSLGVTGLLQDALQWAEETGRNRLAESDLVRVVRWRAELQESASVRWAIRQLSQGQGSALFDGDGQLRGDALDPDAWSALKRAARLSARAGMPFLGTPHVIAALCTHRGTLVEAADQAGVDPRRLHEELLRIVGQRPPALPEFGLSRRTLTPRLTRMLAAAWDLAEQAGSRIREQELLEVFLQDGGSSLDLVRALGLVAPLRETLLEKRQERPATHREARRPDLETLGAMPDAPGATEGSTTPVLDQIGRDLTADPNLPDVLGRDTELQRVINVLLRSEQRNPLLTGEAGVGKTAIAAALARRIQQGRVPRRLQGMRVVEINGASLVGGTSYRGELEARIRSLLQEAEDGVILFMDEAHAVFAPRSNSGQPAEVPNHFKAALASGRIAVVAATTEAEYHRWIEQDPALRRRFERIEVPELSADLSQQILRGLIPRYERDYEVRIDGACVKAAVEWSMRFLPEQSLPDKAKKLLMDTAIAVAGEVAAGLRADDSTPQPFERPEGESEGPASLPRVQVLDVAHQLAARTGIPLHRIAQTYLAGLSDLGDRLGARHPGQAEAAREVAHRLVTGRLTGSGRRRPEAVFLFAGTPGSGRERLARSLAQELFGSDRHLLQLNMADYAEAHAMSRLIGTPPGYVGYQDEDALVTPLRRRPASVVLLRDFDLAHPRVQERLIRMFDEGEIADTRGLRADCSHAIFVLTVALDTTTRPGVGFQMEGEGAPPAQLLRTAHPELHDRLKGYAFELVLFRGTRDESLAWNLFLERLADFERGLDEDFGLRLVLTDRVRAQLQQHLAALDDLRDLERIFHRLVVEPIGRLLLQDVPGPTVVLPDPDPPTPGASPSRAPVRQGHG